MQKPVVISFLTVLLMSLGALALRQEIRVNELSTVKMSEQIRFGDILFDADTSAGLERNLFDIVISEAMNSEQELTLTRQQIVETLRKAISFQELQSYRLVIPEVVRVRSKRNYLSRMALKKQILGLAQKFCTQCEIEIEDLMVPNIDLKAEVLGVRLLDENLRGPGTFLLPLVLETSNGQQQIHISGKLNLFKLAPVAQRMIHAGSKISAADFEMKRVNLTYARDGIADLANNEAVVAAKNIALGQTIFAGDLKSEPAALRGQIVKAVIQGDNFEVSTNAIAEQNGQLGEIIKVKNLVTQKVVMAKVIDKGLVRIE